jgi:serine phosphatase RsbU (regulator of sigma subunit)
MFGEVRLDAALHGCRPNAEEIIQKLLKSLDDFTHRRPADDDRTILVAKLHDR